MNEEMTPEFADLSKYETHVCMVSKQAAANFVPIVCYRPRNVILLVTKEMRQAADWLGNALSVATPGTKVSVEVVENSYDSMSEKAIEIFEKVEGSIAFNFTGGTKLMALGLFNMASGEESSVLYYQDEETNDLLVIKKGKLARVKPETRHKLEHYLAAYGYHAKRVAASPMSEDVMHMLRNSFIATEGQRKTVSQLNYWASQAERTLSVKTDRDYATPAFDALCDQLEREGYFSYNNGTIRFPNEDKRFFVAGGWLEHYVYTLASQAGLKPVTNLEVQGEKAKNELDVAFMKDGYTYIVECKTSKLGDLEEANKVIYKLEALRGISGRKTKLVLVSCQEVHRAAKERAKQFHINIIDGNALRSLNAAAIKSW